jgi:hypothetical protein
MLLHIVYVVERLKCCYIPVIVKEQTQFTSVKFWSLFCRMVSAWPELNVSPATTVQQRHLLALWTADAKVC